MVIPCERTLFSSADLNFSVRNESFAVRCFMVFVILFMPMHVRMFQSLFAG